MKNISLKLKLITNRIPFIIADIFGLSLLFWFAWSLKMGEFTKVDPLVLILIPIISIPIFIRYGLYRAVVRYIGYRALWTIFQATGFAVLSLVLITHFIHPHQIALSTFVIYWMATLIYIDGSRHFSRWRTARIRKIPGDKRRPVVIFGAGDAGTKLIKALEKNPRLTPVALIDDQRTLVGEFIGSLRIYGREHLNSLIENYGVEEVLLALPSVRGHERQKIIEWLEDYPVHVRTLPSLMEIRDGKVVVQDIREIGLDDLLGRDPVPPMQALLDRCIQQQSVMVNGAGGSIGSELCRQVIQLKPKCLVLYDISEFALYSIEKELRPLTTSLGIELVAALGCVTNKSRVARFVKEYKIDTIYHAAAYKHVPLVEYNIIEGVRNNIFGTLRVAEVAAQYKVRNLVLISTDKAVRPTNVMGASKRMAEMILQAFQNKYHKTNFTMVRFGNVLGSSGSVIPLFWEQINTGGPITVTHRDINRYFMTISEAASLVIQAGAMGQGGDVFVLDMGEPVKIYDLAVRMVRLSGLSVAQRSHTKELSDEQKMNLQNTIDIQITGLRPGEKLYEELMLDANITGTEHPKIMRADDKILALKELKPQLNILEQAIMRHQIKPIFDVFINTVDGFQHNGRIVDYLDSPHHKMEWESPQNKVVSISKLT